MGSSQQPSKVNIESITVGESVISQLNPFAIWVYCLTATCQWVTKLVRSDCIMAVFGLYNIRQISKIYTIFLWMLRRLWCMLSSQVIWTTVILSCLESRNIIIFKVILLVFKVCHNVQAPPYLRNLLELKFLWECEAGPKRDNPHPKTLESVANWNCA